MPTLDRHPAILAKMSFFEYEHLPEHLRRVSQRFHDLAWDAFHNGELDGEQLTLGLQKLLEAKDCFVRAALPKKQASETEGLVEAYG
jgi:hypothetical protein